jgi:hypothetical protein
MQTIKKLLTKEIKFTPLNIILIFIVFELFLFVLSMFGVKMDPVHFKFHKFF